MMVTKHVLAEIGCRLYLKSRWGWVRACWVRSEAVGQRHLLPLLFRTLGPTATWTMGNHSEDSEELP